MAKINLLTIHWGNCYGAVCQTYATCKVLENLGHDVTVINLVHPRVRKQYNNLSKLSYIPLDYSFYGFKKRYFSKMTKMMYCASPKEIPDAEYTIIGSDQVWNRDITTNLSLTYFLDFVKDSKRISLASSFGKSEWKESPEYTQSVKRELEKFTALSVRESSGVKICKEVFGLNATQVVDPTLGLCDFSEFVDGKPEKDEIFTFLFNPDDNTHQIVSRLSTLLGLPVSHSTRWKDRMCSSPKHWLNNIHNSKFIVTSSFHGLALSLIYHKPFVVLCADERKFTRLATLLELVGLSHRYVPSVEYLEQHKDMLVVPIDYSKVDVVLKQESDRFRKFLSDNIK